MILEGIVTTVAEDGTLNVAPMGPDVAGGLDRFVLRPYRTSTTFRNLQSTGVGVLHITDDAGLIARAAIKQLGPVATRQAAQIRGAILATTGRYHEFRVVDLDATTERARITVATVAEGRQPVDLFGFNRAKHAVVEAAILATRLEFIPRDQILDEYQRLAPWVAKTGGVAERQAFELLVTYVQTAKERV